MRNVVTESRFWSRKKSIWKNALKMLKHGLIDKLPKVGGHHHLTIIFGSFICANTLVNMKIAIKGNIMQPAMNKKIVGSFSHATSQEIVYQDYHMIIEIYFEY